MSRLVVVGLGYVGLPMALRAAEVGHDVCGYDLNRQIVDQLNAGSSHIGDVSDHKLRQAVASGRFAATADPRCIASAEVIIVCVPTPLNGDGGPDLAALRSSAQTIGRHVADGALVILESTTYPGTTEEEFAPLVLSSRRPMPSQVKIAFSPERINPGDETYHIKNTAKVVGGLGLESTLAARDFYATFVDEVVTAAGVREAEMAKLIENTFRHVNIALVNEMLRFCGELDIDLWNAIDCASSKPFGYMPFRPGPGVGGHCIPVDPSYLSHRVRAKLGYSFRMVELAEEINHAAPLYVANRAWQLLNIRGKPVKGSKILLLGITYKENVGDMRETPARPLADQLSAWGADVSYCDPYVTTWSLGGKRIDSLPSPEAGAAASDLTILLQPHRAFDIAGITDSADILLDTRGMLNESDNVQRL